IRLVPWRSKKTFSKAGTVVVEATTILPLCSSTAVCCSATRVSIVKEVPNAVVFVPPAYTFKGLLVSRTTSKNPLPSRELSRAVTEELSRGCRLLLANRCAVDWSGSCTVAVWSLSLTLDTHRGPSARTLPCALCCVDPRGATVADSCQNW